MVSALALAVALFIMPASAAAGDPVSYEAVLAAEAAAAQAEAASVASGDVASGATSSSATFETAAGTMVLSEEQQTLMAEQADWSARVTLYHAGGGGATGNDSLGCRPIPMRTLAVDPRRIPRRTRLFIPETVGMQMPDGTVHDGFWYASDTGGVIRGLKVDFYTGHGRASMRPAMRFNTRNVTLVEAGRFEGCPPSWDAVPSQMTRALPATSSSFAAP